MRPRLLLSLVFAAAAPLLALCCDNGGASSSGSSGGDGGQGGCPVAPTALFTLTITAQDGPIPSDTRIFVTWSAGPEPVFAMNDPSTWATLDEGANVVCNVDRHSPPEEPLDALICALWTSGATKVQVSAEGYEDVEETFTSPQSELCEGPVPSKVALTLVPESDAGAR